MASPRRIDPELARAGDDGRWVPALLRQVVERVAGEKIRRHATRRAPVAEQVRAARDRDALGGAEMLEVGDRHGIRRLTLEPLRRVDVVADLATAQEGIASYRRLFSGSLESRSRTH